MSTPPDNAPQPRSMSTPAVRRSSTMPMPRASVAGVRSASRNGNSPSAKSKAAARQQRNSMPSHVGVGSSGAGAEKEEEGSMPMRMEDVCAICLGDVSDGFVFPCGSHHKFHFSCALDMLMKALPGSPGTFAAVSDAVLRCDRHELRRIRCPLCRAPWPYDGTIGQSALEMLHKGLGDLQIRAAERLGNALGDALERYVKPDPRDLLRFGWRSLRRAAPLFPKRLLKRWVGDVAVVCFLSFLQSRAIEAVRSTCRSCDCMCRAGNQVRASHIRIRRVHVAVERGYGSDIMTLDVDSAARGWQIVGGLNHRDLQELNFWLITNTVLRSLTLSCCNLDRADTDGRNIAELLQAKRHLQHLDLSNNSLSDEALGRIAKALAPAAIRGLNSLQLELNCMTKVGLAALLQHCGVDKVRMWALRHNALGDEGIFLLAHAEWPSSISTTRLVSLDLRRNDITATGAEALSVLVVGSRLSSTALGYLSVGCNNLGDEGGAKLFLGGQIGSYGNLRLGPCLAVLDLTQAKVGDKTAAALSRSLREAPSLRELRLCHNRIGPQGADDLGKSLQHPLSLEALDLSSNPFGSDGVSLMFEHSPSWTQKNLSVRLLSVECTEGGGMVLARVVRNRAQDRSLPRLVVNVSNNSGISLSTHREIMRFAGTISK